MQNEQDSLEKMSPYLQCLVRAVLYSDDVYRVLLVVRLHECRPRLQVEISAQVLYNLFPL